MSVMLRCFERKYPSRHNPCYLRRKSSLVIFVPMFFEDVLSLPPKCEIENLVGLVPIENYNHRDVWYRVVERIE